MNTTNKVVARTVIPEKIAVGLIRRVAEEITFHHQDLKITPKEIGRHVVLTISAHAGDTPRLIGGGGMTHKALDCVAAAIGNKYGVDFRVRIEEPTVGTKDRYEQFKATEDWNKDGILKLIQEISDQIFIYPVDIKVQDEGKDTSVFSITVAPTEKQSLVEPVKKALQILSNAIGKANGRIVLLDLAAEGAETKRDLGSIFG